MKKDVTIYHKISRILVGVVFLVLLAAGGCSNVLMKSPAAPEAAGPGGGVKVTLRLFTGSARTVMPEMDLLTWHITAEQGTDNIEATGTYPTYTLELPTVGRWIFTVKGINPTGDEIFTGDVTQEIGGGSSVTISIPLSPGSAMTAGTGQINLTLKVPDTVGTVMYKLDGESGFTDLSLTNGSCILNKTGVSAGIHTLSLYFLDERGTTLYMCTEAVNVWNGMTSSQWIDTGNAAYITNKGEFELTETIIDKFLETMGSVVFVDASVDADTPATGSIFAPVNSVSKAVDILRKANPDGNYSAAIMVTGATAIDQEIEVQTNETLTVKGTGASITNTTGRVFNITGGSVTLGDGITLTGTVTGENARGGAVYVTGGNFTMESGSTIADSSVQGTSASGGGVYVMNGTFIMEDGSKITGSSATVSGGGVAVSTGGTFTMRGGTIDGTGANSNAESGGGVEIYDAIFTMEGGTITGNNATYGGGVRVDSGEFTMKDGTISDNNATELGGGVCVIDGSFTMSDTATIQGNTATTHGGGVYVNGGNFEMIGGTIGGTDAGSANSAQYGGGVYVNGGEFEMTGTAILQGNTATTHGGGVHILSGGTFTMNGGTIVGTAENTANYGGGVFVSGGEFIMNDGSISGNTVTQSGGGVFVNAGNFTMKGGTIGGTTANTATQNGGGVFVQAGTFNMTGTAVIQGNEATGGSSHACGGGVYVNGGEFTMTGTTIIQDNKANSTNGHACGGGVYVNGTGKFDMGDTATIQGNNASTTATNSAAGGGGVYVNGGTFTMTGTAKIQGNTTTSANPYTKPSGGGGVFVIAGGTFTMSGGTIGSSTDANEADLGGGVYVGVNTGTGEKGSFTMGGGTITGNTATQNGGGVYVNSLTFTVTGTPSINNNTANSSANNVHLISKMTITIGEDGLAGGEIGVTAEEMKPGTAVQITDKNVNNAASIFTSDEKGYRIEENVNVKVEDGGTAVFLSDTETSYSTDGNGGVSLGDFEEAFNAIIENTGGDITVFDPVEIAGDNMQISPPRGVTIDITASGATTVFEVQDGGSLTLGGGDGEVNVSGDPSASSPTADGEEISLINISNGGTVTIADNANIQNNQAGRGVTVDNGRLIMTGGSIKGNTGGYSYGSGVYVSGSTAEFKMSGGEIRGNELKLGKQQNRQGAGVMVCNGATFTLSDSGKITDNSGYEGVGVTVSGSTFNMKGGEISNNEGMGTSGGVYLVSYATMNMNGGTIIGNKAKMSSGAGGVYIGLSCNFTGSTDSTTASITENYVGSSNVDVYFQSGGNGTYSPGNVTVGVGP